MSGFKRHMINDGGLSRAGIPGDPGNPVVETVATAGDLTITASAIAGGIARFTGAAGAVTYTLPTKTVLAPVLKGMNVGDVHRFTLINTAAQTATVAVAAGISNVTGNILTCNAAAKTLLLVKTAGTLADGTDATYDLYMY